MSTRAAQATSTSSSPEPTPSAVYGRMRRLAQGALVVLTGFLASRVLGVVRSMVIAAHFGTGVEANAYVAAIVVPDTVFQVLVGGAVGSAFIPVFQRYQAHGRDDDAWRMTSSVLNLGVLVAGGTALVLAIFARPLMDVLIAPQDPEFRELAANLSRILLITPALFAASTLCASVLNSYHRFAVAALAPLMYNLAIIGGAFFLSEPLGIYGLAIGAAFGAVLHLLIQVPALIRLGMRWLPIVDLHHSGVREVALLFAPRVLGLGVMQFNKLLSGVVFASFLVAGSIAYLDYAWLMIMTPLALAMAVGTAVFPTMSQASALEHRSQVQQVFQLSLRMILFLTIPASVGLMVLGEPVIRLLFQHGNFNDESTRGTAYALVFFSIGLVGHATVEIADRVFYALHDTRSPVLIAVGAIGLNVILSLLFMQIWMRTDPDHAFGGLALANSIAALVEAAILLRVIAVRLPFELAGLSTSALRILAASLVMGLPVTWLARQLSPMLLPYGTPGLAFLLALCVGSGALLYALVSLSFRSDELHALWRLVRH